MRFLLSSEFIQQLKHDAYNEHNHQNLRQASSDLPEESTELLDEMGTTDETIGESTEDSMDTTTGTISEQFEDFSDTMYTTKLTTFQEAVTTVQTSISPSDSPSDLSSNPSSDSGQTVLIVLGILLGILVIVCCVLACIFAKLRRKGFCTVEGKNQAMCDEECLGGETSAQMSPKESMSSGKTPNSRSSDKLLTK